MQNFTSIYTKYQNLPPIEKKIVQMKSLLVNHLAKTHFMNFLNQTYLVQEYGKNFSNYNFTSILQKFIKLDIFSDNNSIQEQIAHKIVLDATRGENAEKNIEAILAMPNEFANHVDYLKIGVYSNNLEIFKKSFSSNSNYSFDHFVVHRIISFFEFGKFPSKYFHQLDISIQVWLIGAKIRLMLIDGKHDFITDVDLREFITPELLKHFTNSNYLVNLILEYLFFDGNSNCLNHLTNLSNGGVLPQESLVGVEFLLKNDPVQSLVYFDNALKKLNSSYKKRNITFSDYIGVFYYFALLSSKKTDSLNNVLNHLLFYKKTMAVFNKEIRNQHISKNPQIFDYYTDIYSNCYYYFEVIAQFVESGNKVNFHEKNLRAFVAKKSLFEHFIFILLLYWSGNQNNKLLEYINILRQQYGENFKWFKDFLTSFDKESIDAKNVHQTDNIYKIDFINIVKTIPEWQRRLDNLLRFFDDNITQTKSNKRLIWKIDTKHNSFIQPFEQTFNSKKSTWSKGREASIMRLYNNMDKLDFITEQDKKVLNCIERDYFDFYRPSVTLNYQQGLKSMIGHQLIFDIESNEKIELVEINSELLIQESEGGFIIKMSHDSAQYENNLMRLEKNKYGVINISDDIMAINNIIGSKNLIIPNDQRKNVVSLMQKAIDKISIKSELANYDDFKTISANHQIQVYLELIENNYENDLLIVKFLVVPFDGKNDNFPPGKGSNNIIMLDNGEYKNMQRDLELELQNANNILAYCPVLSEQKHYNYQWKIDNLSIILEILYELRKCQQQHDLIVNWPKNDLFHLKPEISFDKLELEVNKDNQWLEFDGRLKIDEKEVVNIRTILDNIDNLQGRFWQLDDKKFIALTEIFAQKLRELQKASTQQNDKQVIHHLGVELIKDLAENSKAITNDTWQEYIQKLDNIQNTMPIVPQKLLAELRPYQIEGFRWLSRLASLGFGGCLADDMGLGKTIQSIGILLEQAKNGACLVIAPASVCNVWLEEIDKFAPSLNCLSLNEQNRIEYIKNLQANDVLICSYGLIYQIEEELLKANFQTLVLDEAQAIKNFNTKRFKITSKIKAKTRIALSGTPIENRVEELWNLFEFLNPGFLGSRQSFNEKYVKPISKNNDVVASNTLKRLIQPFILRRTKDKVLTDLPDKIEQTIFIEPTTEEKSFYEALRQKALERVNKIDEADAAKKRFCMLSEITKLRRACCDCSLVNENIQIPNSKLDFLDSLLLELKENNHRALIFSQYVDYLSLVKKRISSSNIKYQYLDGKTSHSQRKKITQEFQEGKGDVFLISLKAGGVGLNLTSADYVIHLDPWWNPAIEDQASDRAYRIGQNKVVTVYRLAMKYSIEEKILALHKQKRSLSISLLDDTDASAALGEKDLIKLLNESFVINNDEQNSGKVVAHG